MDEDTFAQLVERLQKVNSVIEGLDPAIRAEAFSILQPFVAGDSAEEKPKSRGAGSSPRRQRKTQRTPRPRATAGTPSAEKTIEIDRTAAETFVRSREHDKPDQVARAIAAWWYSEFGAAPLSNKQIRAIADEIGVTVPRRPDMTLKQTRVDGKQVFRSDKGKLIPTVPHGELFLRNEYGVTKGRKSLPSTEKP